MRIQILNNYGGDLTHDQRIEPGVYDVGDERLFGIEAYLVENGHAVYVDDETVFTPAAPTPEPLAWRTMTHEEEMAALGRGEQIQGVESSTEGDTVSEGVSLGGFLLDGDTEPLDDEPPALDYDEWTVDELRAECSRRGIDLEDMDGSGANGNLLKADLIEILRGDDLDTDVEE